MSRKLLRVLGVLCAVTMAAVCVMPARAQKQDGNEKPATHAVGTVSPQVSKDERTIWRLERAYWYYVQENDLTGYLYLWHKDFLGWPAANAAPVHKDHITDWIASQTAKGLAFKSGELKPAAIQITGDVAEVAYWMTYKWVDKDGAGADHVLRITHTWIKTGKGWQILGGMSMPEAAAPQE